MNCTTDYLKTDEGEVIAVMRFERNRDDDPNILDILVEKHPGRCSQCGGCGFTTERGGLESHPFKTLEGAQGWVEMHLGEVKRKIEAYRNA